MLGHGLVETGDLLVAFPNFLTHVSAQICDDRPISGVGIFKFAAHSIKLALKLGRAVSRWLHDGTVDSLYPLPDFRVGIEFLFRVPMVAKSGRQKRVDLGAAFRRQFWPTDPEITPYPVDLLLPVCKQRIIRNKRSPLTARCLFRLHEMS
jgi:hypothetical protein